MLIKLIAKAVISGVVVYGVMETLDRLKVANRVVDLADAVVTGVAKLIPIPGDTE